MCVCLVASACLDQLSVWYLHGSHFSQCIWVMVLCCPTTTSNTHTHTAPCPHCVSPASDDPPLTFLLLPVCFSFTLGPAAPTPVRSRQLREGVWNWTLLRGFYFAGSGPSWGAADGSGVLLIPSWLCLAASCLDTNGMIGTSLAAVAQAQK